jgi:uncharacterized protein involved in exopolysaccharide biosynthesis
MTSPSSRPGLLRRTLRRRWIPILTQWAILTVALFSAAYILVQGPYRAVSLIRVAPATSDLYGVQTGGESFDSFLQTQVQLITSPNVLTAAGTNPKAAVLPTIAGSKDVVADLGKVIKVNVIPGTYLIELSSATSSPSESATLVNSVVDAFMEANVEWSDGMTRTQIKNLESYLGDLRNQTEEMERRWKVLVAKGDAGRKARESNLVSPEHGAKIEERLIENELRRIEAEATLDALRSREAKDSKKIEELEIEIEAARNIEKILNARRVSGDFDARNPKTLEIEITLIRDQREGLKSMQEAVNRRLEQLKFEAKGEARVRPVNAAVPPGRHLDLWYRPWVLLAIPFATFLATFGLFACVEAWKGPPVEVVDAESPAEA